MSDDAESDDAESGDVESGDVESGDTDGAEFESFVLTPASDLAGAGDEIVSGGTAEDAARRARRLTRKVANPGDPPVWRPRGAHPGPDYSGAPGRLAIVQGQIYIVGVILVAQLWLVTTALFELLSGHRGPMLWWMALASGVGFVIALVVALWPRRRTQGL